MVDEIKKSAILMEKISFWPKKWRKEVVRIAFEQSGNGIEKSSEEGERSGSWYNMDSGHIICWK